MSVDFSWTDEPIQHSAAPPPPHRHRRAYGLLLLLGAGLALGLWFAVRWISMPTASAIEQALNAALEEEMTAFAAGDARAFLAAQPSDPAWQAAQLWPDSLAMYRAGRTLSDFQRDGNHVVARTAWSTTAGTMHRVTFWRWDDGVLQPAPNAPRFWGSAIQAETPWGQLILSEADGVWQEELTRFISSVVDATCDPACAAERLPLTVEITPAYAATAAPARVVMPSPHLIAVDETGAPGPEFRAMLRARLEDALAPAVIRFAAPSADEANYAAAAQRFHALRQDVRVEIVTYDESSGLDLHAVDGALLIPGRAGATPGGIVDLTDFAATDPTFNGADFHPFLWDGVRWRDRVWAVPLAGRWSLYYSDMLAHEAAGLDPKPPTDWSALAQQIVRLTSATANAGLSTPFADFSGDSLLSVAGGQQCASRPSACQERLAAPAVEQALVWYASLRAVQPDAPDLTQMSTAERRSYALNNLSRPRDIAVWIDAPTYYEHNVQIAPLEMAALPPQAQPGATPIHVFGGVISAHSAHPRAVWLWLSFLSRERPINQPRALPARQSVTDAVQFWQRIPATVRAPMGSGLESGRVVRMDEQQIFRPEISDALLAGGASIDELAARAVELDWLRTHARVAR